MADSVATKVAEKIKSLGAAAVEEAAIAIMVDRTLKKRTDAVVSVIDKIETGERELRKLVADQISYDGAGTKTGETFSKAVIDARQQANQKIGKLRKALDKALNDGDFGDVLNLANEKGG